MISVVAVLGVVVYSAKNKPPSVITQPQTSPTPEESFSCGDSVVKDIDGNEYKTVKIGEQCWLKENLKVTKNPQGKPITRYCYDNDPKICDTDGGLYDWNTTMNGSNQEGAQGICPDGWHVPKDSEWYVLENYLKDPGQDCDGTRLGGGCAAAGTNLKRGGSSGFGAILAGFRFTDGSFVDRGAIAYFWSSTESESEEGGYDTWGRYLDSSYATVVRFTDDNAFGFSVRCLKD